VRLDNYKTTVEVYIVLPYSLNASGMLPQLVPQGGAAIVGKQVSF
jgi:hypothetical protein